MAQLIGQTLGSYRVLDRIGNGGRWRDRYPRQASATPVTSALTAARRVRAGQPPCVNQCPRRVSQRSRSQMSRIATSNVFAASQWSPSDPGPHCPALPRPHAEAHRTTYPRRIC